VWLAARGSSQSEIAIALALPTLLRVATAPVVTAIAHKRRIAETLAAHPGFCLRDLCDDCAGLEGATRRRTNSCRNSPRGSCGTWPDHLCPHPGMDIDWYIRNDALAWLGRRHVSGREALAGLTHLPALVTLFAATKLKHLHVHVSIKGTLTRDQAQPRLAFAFIGAAALIQASHAEWAIGVASETVLLLLAARYLAAERNAASFPNLGAFGAIFRWLAMSSDPSLVPLFLQAMHGLSFGATYFGSVLLLGGIARETHRARMQGWLASASALSLALATFASGWLTRHFGEKSYLAMAALAMAGLVLALIAGAMKRRIGT
jgi:hypothetical protein